MRLDASPTSEDVLIDLHAQWARLGVLLRVPSTDAPVDVERLLIASAQAASDDARLPMIVASWLAAYGAVVDADRAGPDRPARRRAARRVADDLGDSRCAADVGGPTSTRTRRRFGWPRRRVGRWSRRSG